MEIVKRNSWQMFDRISKTYDRINHILSFGIDIIWRKKVANLVSKAPIELLDLATGTGDQLLSILKRRENITRAVGLDPSFNMLSVARKKAPHLEFVEGTATDLPFEEASFDAITISFGIRNVDETLKGLQEMHRVLKPDGEALILEFSLPKNRLVKTLHFFYLRHVLPRIGGLLSKNKEAYVYLNKTIETFPSGEAFCDLMKEAGFSSIVPHPLTFGIATIYQGKK